MWLDLIALFLLTEAIFGMGYLEWLTGAITGGVSQSSGAEEIKILKVITEPLVNLIIQVLKHQCADFITQHSDNELCD